jgi:hypothetical protein
VTCTCRQYPPTQYTLFSHLRHWRYFTANYVVTPWQIRQSVEYTFHHRRMFPRLSATSWRWYHVNNNPDMMLHHNRVPYRSKALRIPIILWAVLAPWNFNRLLLRIIMRARFCRLGGFWALTSDYIQCGLCLTVCRPAALYSLLEWNRCFGCPILSRHVWYGGCRIHAKHTTQPIRKKRIYHPLWQHIWQSTTASLACFQTCAQTSWKYIERYWSLATPTQCIQLRHVPCHTW